MLKHILTGQPSSTAGSRLHHHHEYLAHPGAAGPARFQHEPAQPQPSNALRAAPTARAQSSADVYDNAGAILGQRAGPQYHRLPPHHHHHHYPHHHPHAGLNHSQLSVNNLAQRLNASHHGPLNLSTLSTSKHSVNSVSPVVGAHLANYAAERSSVRQHNFSIASQHQLSLTGGQHRHKPNGGLDISRMSARFPGRPTPSPAPATAASVPTLTTATATTTTSTGGQPSIAALNSSWSSSSNEKPGSLEPGLKEVLSSLGLLCLVSLLLALISLTFLIRMSSVSLTPNSLISAEEFATVYDVTLVLCALALILNLCCLLVCAIQFLFAVKLVKAPYHGQR